MKAVSICLLLASVRWRLSVATDVFSSTLEKKNAQEQLLDKANGTKNGIPESDSNKYFLPPVSDHDDEDDIDDDEHFYPKPHFHPLFYPFHHHHKPEEHEKPTPEHHEKPKPPPKPIHKPEHHKPDHHHKPLLPIDIHYQPIHKPVHIHIHKPTHHPVKPPHKPVHHRPEHHKPEHHKPEHHKPPKLSSDCNYSCNETKLDDGIETIEITDSGDSLQQHYDTENAHQGNGEVNGAVDKDDRIYPPEEVHYVGESFSQAGNYDEYETTYQNQPNPSKPVHHKEENNLSSGNGVPKPITQLSDLLAQMAIPWLSQHVGEKTPEKETHLEDLPQPSTSDSNDDLKKDHKKPCNVHHHYHLFYPVKGPQHHHYAHVPIHGHHPHGKPHKPSYHLSHGQKEGVTSSATESTTVKTSEQEATIPYYQYDVSTKSTTEEENPEVESHSQKPKRKPKPKPSYRPLSQMLPQILWPFTPNPTRTKTTRKTLPIEDKSNEESEDEEDDDDDLFSAFF